MSIVKMTNADSDFYPLIGPFLSRREIVGELGYPVWDEDGKHWFVAIDRGRVQGFCAFRVAGKKATLTSDYVRPEYRGQGVYRRLFETRMKAIEVETLEATVTTAGKPMFLRHEFTAIRETKHYTVFRRDV